MKESRSGADYLEEVYDALSAVWDKSKFNLKKGYDDEYDCECVVITLREDPKFISKTYVIEPGDANFVAGRPTAFQTVWHFPGDHGVGVAETLEFQSTDLDDFAVEAFDYFEELKQRASRTAESKKGDNMKTEANIEDLKGMVVSEGTMGVNALIRKYLAVLETYAPDNYKAYIEANPELKDRDVWMALDVKDKSYIVDELADELDKIAPEGYYFGASEGDGACFGFWSAEQDESKKKGAKRKKEDFNPSAEFYLAKGAIDDWLDRNKVVSYDYDGATVGTYRGAQPKGDWTVTWDAEDGEHTAVVHAGSFETKFNSFDDRIDLSLVKDGGKPMWYTSASDMLYALGEYINATLKGKTEAKKSKGKISNSRFCKMSEGNASDYVGKYYVDIEDEDEDALYSSDMEFDSPGAASVWAFDELKKSKDDTDVFQASVYQLFVNDDGDLDHELVEVIHKSDLDESKKEESLASDIRKAKPKVYLVSEAGDEYDYGELLDAFDGEQSYVSVETADKSVELPLAFDRDKNLLLIMDDEVVGDNAAYAKELVQGFVNGTSSVSNKPLTDDFVCIVDGMDYTATCYVPESKQSEGTDDMDNKDGKGCDDSDEKCVSERAIPGGKYGRKGESLSESLTLKQKELKDMARFGQAEDITTISDEEAKALRKKGIETIGVSRGTYGMNGALLRDNEGKKYVITSRSSNLFYFV